MPLQALVNLRHAYIVIQPRLPERILNKTDPLRTSVFPHSYHVRVDILKQTRILENTTVNYTKLFLYD